MDKNQFLISIQDILQRDDQIDENMSLNNLTEWDSQAILSVAGFFATELDINLNLSDLLSCKTVKDLIQKAGIE